MKANKAIVATLGVACIGLGLLVVSVFFPENVPPRSYGFFGLMVFIGGLLSSSHASSSSEQPEHDNGRYSGE